MELETLWRIVDEGSTPAIAAIAYFLWKMERTLNAFIIELRAEKTARDLKLNSMHSDIGAMIRKLAGLNGKVNT